MRDDVDEDELLFERIQRSVSVHPGKVRSKRRKEQFVQVPLWWAAAVFEAVSSPKAFFVAIWLLHLAWKAKSNTFQVPNGQLKAYGISRKTKERALRELEKARLITVERHPRKTTVVTLVVR